MGTNKNDAATTRARVMEAIDRYAQTYARWARGEATDRMRANARARVERALAKVVR